MTQALLWFEELVSSDAFVLMCLMFVSIGLLELAFPARKIPWRHYWFNLTYAFVNIVAISVVTPFISAATAYGIQTIGLGLIDLRSIGLDGTSGAFFALLVGTLIFDFFLYWQHRLEHGNKIRWQPCVLRAHCWHRRWARPRL